MDLRFGIGLLTLVLAVSPGLAREENLNGVVIDVPSGWTVERGEAGSLLIAQEFPETDDYEQGAVIIQLIAPRGIEGTLAQGMAQVVNAFPDMAEEDTTTDSVGVTSNGYEMIMEYRCCGEIQDISAGLTTIAVGSPTKQAYLQMVSMNMDGDREDEIDAEFATMARTMRLNEGDKPFAVEPQDGDGGLEGVYTYLRTGLTLNPFGGMDFTADSEITVFDTSGLFSDTIPANMDMAAHCADNPRDCGTYKVTGGGFWGGAKQLEMRSVIDEFGTFEVEVSSLDDQDGGLSIDDNFHAKLPAFDAGTTFDGQWRYFWAQTGSMAFSSNSIAVERLLTMTPDGRFEQTGFSGASGSMDSGIGTTSFATSSDRPPESGSYRVDGYTLVLSGDDGKEQVLSIFAPDIGSDEVLVINGSNYLKQ
nr:hypothetical protein [uncultured Devosia sp.]